MKLRLLAPAALIAAVVVLATMNLTAEAEPSWLERTLAFGLLQTRIALSGTPKAVPSDSNDKRSREIYQQRGVHIVRGITTLPEFQIRFLLIQDPNGNVIQLFDRRT